MLLTTRNFPTPVNLLLLSTIISCCPGALQGARDPAAAALREAEAVLSSLMEQCSGGRVPRLDPFLWAALQPVA